MDIELKLPITKEECLKKITAAFPQYYTVAENLMPPKYSYKVKKHYVLLIGRGIGYPEVVLEVYLTDLDGETTQLEGIFREPFIMRLFIWACSLIMFGGSILFIWGITKEFMRGERSFHSEPLITFILPIVVPIIAILYVYYTEKATKREKQRMIELLANLF